MKKKSKWGKSKQRSREQLHRPDEILEDYMTDQKPGKLWLLPSGNNFKQVMVSQSREHLVITHWLTQYFNFISVLLIF